MLKSEGCRASFGAAGSPSNIVAWVEAYLHTKCYLHPSSHLATIYIDMRRKVGSLLICVRFWDGSQCNTMWPGLRPTSVSSGILIIRLFGHNRHEPKSGVCSGAGSPSDTRCPGPRPTTTPSDIFIRSTVWPQYTNVTDSETGQERQQSDSIGRTVNGRPKTC